MSDDFSFIKKRPTTEHGNKSEARLRKELGGRATPGSGNVEGFKGDIRLQEYLMECKSTLNRTMNVEHAWLAKIYREALGSGKTPALSVSFVDTNGRALPMGDWVMIPKHEFQRLTEK